MSKPLPLDDFRARRWVLERDDYAIVEGEEEIPATDLINPKTWHALVNLPDDIAIRISNHHGSLLAKLYGLWGDWIEAIGDEQDAMSGAMLDAADCFKSSTFDFLHGFYRSSISNLRTAVELVSIGALGNTDAKNQAYKRWNEAGGEIPFFGCLRYLRKTPGGRSAKFISANGIVEQLYRRLCDFAHSRPSASDGVMWEGTGPVYNNDAIRLTASLQLGTYASCYLLVKLGRPAFSIPGTSSFLFDEPAFGEYEYFVRVTG